MNSPSSTPVHQGSAGRCSCVHGRIVHAPCIHGSSTVYKIPLDVLPHPSSPFPLPCAAFVPATLGRTCIAMASDIHAPTELPAPSHLVRELRRRPLLRLRPPVGAGSPWIAGIDVVFNLRPPRRHRRIRRRRSTPGLLDLAYDTAVRSSLDSRSSLLDPCL